MKHLITITAKVLVEVDPKAYLGATTDEERLEIDMENAREDTFEMLGYDNVEWEFKGELLP